MSADAIVLAALSLEGLSYGDPSTRERYMETIYPLDAISARAGMASTQSSCGLTCEAVLRIAEVDGLFPWRELRKDWLRIPYTERLSLGRYAIAAQVSLASARGCWMTAKPGARPEAGDMVLIGHSVDRTFGGGEHVLTVVEAKGALITSIDGGQTDTRNSARPTAIALRVRELVELPPTPSTPGTLWLGPAGAKKDALGRPTGARRVVGWVKAGSLPCVASKAV